MACQRGLKTDNYILLLDAGAVASVCAAMTHTARGLIMHACRHNNLPFSWKGGHLQQRVLFFSLMLHHQISALNLHPGCCLAAVQRSGKAAVTRAAGRQCDQLLSRQTNFFVGRRGWSQDLLSPALLNSAVSRIVCSRWPSAALWTMPECAHCPLPGGIYLRSASSKIGRTQ